MRLILLIAFLHSCGCSHTSTPTLPWLRADGLHLVDSAGRPVQLRGINLGGWLVEEMWMCPVQTQPPAGSSDPPITDHVSLWATITQRLGPDAAARIRRAWRDNWITEDDFDRIHSAGFNSVRLPFLYSLLDEPDGLARIDRAIDWARARGLYVILDLHGAPGRQSKEHHTGQAGRNEFFTDPKHIEHCERIWRTLARRYRSRPEVAGFDLLNEPTGAPNLATLYLVQNRLYRAIRQLDNRHLIFIEDAFTGADGMPTPASVVGWHNVVYSLHTYTFTAKSEDDHLRKAETRIAEYGQRQQQWGVPVYLGEFNHEPHGSPRTMRALFDSLRPINWSWSLWTYKIVKPQGNQSMWGLYRNPDPVDPIDPFRDTEAQMIAKLRSVRTEHLTIHPGLRDALAAP